MIRSDGRVVALLPVFDGDVLARRFNGTSVLGHTVERLRRCERLGGIVLLHDATLDAEAAAALTRLTGHGVQIVRTDAPLADAGRARRLAARAFSPTAWRGGLGGATCYDEVLAAEAMAETMQRVGATAGLLVGADWVVVDPDLCDAVAARHLAEPEQLRLTFTQAAVGLCGCVIERGLMSEIAEKGGSIGGILEYSVARPQGDPIAKDLCVQIDPAIRDAGVRAVCDGTRWCRLLRTFEHDGDAAEIAGKELATRLRQRLAVTRTEPQHITIELTTRRLTRGPVVPQHHVTLDRPDMTRGTAERLIEQAAGVPDATITFGGLGDALLHDDWESLVGAAKEAGVAGVHVETDLLVERDVLDRLLASGVDVLSVNINADRDETYERLMGVDGFGKVLGNIEYLLNRQRELMGKASRLWVAPRLVKVAENVAEIESFFDRWMYFCGHAVIVSPTTGCGAAPDHAVVNMAGPRRRPCRQLQTRMTVLSDGRPAMCDQDWFGEGMSGEPGDDLAVAWRSLDPVRELHATGRAAEHDLCGRCREWHRP